MDTKRKAPRSIEVNRDGVVVQVASFRLPRETWLRYREIIEAEARTTSADLRRYVEQRIDADEKAAA